MQDRVLYIQPRHHSPRRPGDRQCHPGNYRYSPGNYRSRPAISFRAGHGGSDCSGRLAGWRSGSERERAAAHRKPTGLRLPGVPRGGTTVRVFWLANISTPGGIQELVNAVRGTADMSWIFSRKAPAAIIFRATPDQAALAEWLINEIDGATGAASAAPAIRKAAAYTYASDTRGDTAVRVYYLPPTVAPRASRKSPTWFARPRTFNDSFRSINSTPWSCAPHPSKPMPPGA